jgi:glucosamine--fructose-6-phosphate aminotransferase (isomerizing)
MNTVENRKFPHAMLSEIYEQPRALRRTLSDYTEKSELNLSRFSAGSLDLTGEQRMLIAASGSSRHAGLVGEILIEDMSGMPVDVVYASEYIYRSTRTVDGTCLAVISQSGETIDTLEALREAKVQGSATIAVTNHSNSAMARLADCSLPTAAGIERAVPATKSFTSQLMVISLLALYAGRVRGTLTAAAVSAHIERLRQIPALIEEALPTWEGQLSSIAKALRSVDTYLYLGRGIHFPIAREGALKLKESAYAAAEGYPAGELKHGPNALVSASAVLVALATKDTQSSDSILRYQKTIQLLRDMKQQGARVIAIATTGDDEVAALAAEAIFVPAAPEHFVPMLEVIPLQLLAYHTAVERGIDVDSPRNLSKAVLVE